MSDVNVEQQRRDIAHMKGSDFMLALRFLDKSEVFLYLQGLAGRTSASDLMVIIEMARQCETNKELREVLEPMSIIEATIEVAPDNISQGRQLQCDVEIRELIALSAMLFNKCCEERKRYGDTALVVAQRGLRLYNWMLIKHPPHKELAEELLENCGAILHQEDIKVVKANLKNLVEDEEKRSIAYEVMSRGYLKYNSLCHLASEALWKDDMLSQVTSLTPNSDILETLKRALTNVDVKKPETLKTAKLVYDQYTKYFGSGDAMKAVIFVRPDLAGEF